MTTPTFRGWTLTTSRESFRIFPKNAGGEAIPVTKVNMFLTLTNAKGEQIIYKRYLHMKQWFYRSSLQAKGERPMCELDVRDEVARILFPIPGKRDGEGRQAGDTERAVDILMWWMAGVPLPA